MKEIIFRFLIVCLLTLFISVLVFYSNKKPISNEIRLLRVYEVCGDVRCYELEINGDTITACSLK